MSQLSVYDYIGAYRLNQENLQAYLQQVFPQPLYPITVQVGTYVTETRLPRDSVLCARPFVVEMTDRIVAEKLGADNNTYTVCVPRALTQASEVEKPILPPPRRTALELTPLISHP